MKLKATITDITHDDLVNLFSTATFGSSWFGIKRPKGSYKGTELEDESDCLEDTWSKIVLNGGKLFFCDYYAEDEEDFYGTKPHEWKGDHMRYDITLDDIKAGIEKAVDNGGWDAECVFDLINDDSCNLDLPEAENLLQIITFGETIYG